jgi:hypothetical protein
LIFIYISIHHKNKITCMTSLYSRIYILLFFDLKLLFGNLWSHWLKSIHIIQNFKELKWKKKNWKQWRPKINKLIPSTLQKHLAPIIQNKLFPPSLPEKKLQLDGSDSEVFHIFRLNFPLNYYPSWNFNNDF